MVESFFGLASRPFCVAPNSESYVPIACCQEAIETSVRCVVRGEGPSTIIAGAGLGKTICAMKIAQRLRDRMQVVLLSSSQLCTRRALLQSILYHLGLPYRETSEGNLRIQLQERLSHPSATALDVVLVIDEAQTLSVKLLDEIRILTNSLCRGKPSVHLVLIGTLKLEDTLAHPHMESLNQRVVSRNYLTPLSHQETQRYVHGKIEWAGGDPASVFEPTAIDAIYRASDGIPRLIEQLADQAILQSGIQAQRPIPASRIGAVWTQLNQLPNPWSEPELTRYRTAPVAAPSAIAEPRADDLSPEFSELSTTDETDHTDETVSTPVFEPSATFEPSDTFEFGSLDEEPPSVNLFQSFIQDPIQEPLVTSGKTKQVRQTSTATLDESFRQLIKDLNLSAIQLEPRDHAFVKAELTSKRSPKPVASAPRSMRPSTYELVGVSVDGDDRDMIVLIEEQDWINPFAIR